MHSGICGNADFRAFNHAAQYCPGSRLSPIKLHIRSSSGAVPGCGEKTFQMLRNGAFGGNWPARFGNGVKVKFNGRFVCADVASASFNDFPQYGRKQCAFAAAHDACYKHKAIGGHCMVRSISRSTPEGRPMSEELRGMGGKLFFTPVEYPSATGVALPR